MDKYVTIASFGEVFRADIAMSKLEEAGIPTRVTDREIVAMEWLLSNAIGGAKVQVREQDVGRALEVLSERRETEEVESDGHLDEEELTRQALAAEPEEDAEDRPTELPPDDDARQTTVPKIERDQYAKRFLRCALFSFPMLPLWFYAVYLGLNATFGSGPISALGWQRIFFGIFLCLLVIPFVVIGLMFGESLFTEKILGR